MTSLPAVPPEADLPPGIAAPRTASLADGSARGLDPRHVPSARIGGGILAAVLLLGGAVGLSFLAFGTETRTPVLVWIACLWGALLVIVMLSAWFYPPLEFRHTSWILSPFGLEIRRGVWFRHALSVPRVRVQHADVERGPLERRFELATLVVHTAGHQHSEIRLEGLEHRTALEVRDYLLATEGADGA